MRRRRRWSWRSRGNRCGGCCWLRRRCSGGSGGGRWYRSHRWARRGRWLVSRSRISCRWLVSRSRTSCRWLVSRSRTSCRCWIGDRCALLVGSRTGDRDYRHMDSVLQAIADDVADGSFGGDWKGTVSVVLCGSAMSVMADILSGTSPLRGRAVLDLPFGSFDYRQAREYWEPNGLGSPMSSGPRG